MALEGEEAGGRGVEDDLCVGLGEVVTGLSDYVGGIVGVTEAFL